MADRLQSGFTLIEILLVLMLIALSTAIIAPSFFSASNAEMDDEVRRLLQVLRLSSEEAQLTGLPMRLTVLKDGYRFERLNAQREWADFAEPPFNEHIFSQGVEILELRLSGFLLSDQSSDLFSKPELESRADDKGERKDEKNLLGYLVFWPDGMLETADIVIVNSDNSAESLSLQLRSGPGGIRLIKEPVDGSP